MSFYVKKGLSALMSRSICWTARVEAMKFTEDSKYKVYNWCRDIQSNVSPSWTADDKPRMIIPREEESEHICNLGDYVVKEPNPAFGKALRVIKGAVFEAHYKEVPADGQKA